MLPSFQLRTLGTDHLVLLGYDGGHRFLSRKDFDTIMFLKYFGCSVTCRDLPSYIKGSENALLNF